MPRDLDTNRMAQYDKLQRVYRGQHTAVFDLDDIDQEQFPAVSVNIATSIVNGLSALITNKTPIFNFKTDRAKQRVDDILEASSFPTELLQFVVEGLVFGDAVFKVFATEAGQVKVRCLSPRLWFPVPDPDDADTIQEHILGFSRIVGNGGEKLFREERHTPGFIQNRVWKVSGSKLTTEVNLETAGQLVPEWAGLEPIIETGVDEPLVISWSYNKLCGELFGTSEFQSIWNLIEMLDRRTSQEDRVLTKHADPKLMLTEGMVERDENGNIIISDLDVILTREGTDKDQIGYIEWDGKLESVDLQLKRIVEWMLHITQTSRLLMNADATQAQTGLAVMAQLLPSIIKARQIQKSLENPLRTTVRVAQKLSSQTGRNFTASPVNIEWGVELPTDLQAMVQAETMAVSAGIKTAEEAREKLDQKETL